MFIHMINSLYGQRTGEIFVSGSLVRLFVCLFDCCLQMNDSNILDNVIPNERNQNEHLVFVNV